MPVTKSIKFQALCIYFELHTVRSVLFVSFFFNFIVILFVFLFWIFLLFMFNVVLLALRFTTSFHFRLMKLWQLISLCFRNPVCMSKRRRNRMLNLAKESNKGNIVAKTAPVYWVTITNICRVRVRVRVCVDRFIYINVNGFFWNWLQSVECY